MAKTQYTIRSLEAAFKVLDCFIEAGGGGLSFSDICQQTGFNKNRVFRILNTLSESAYLVRDPKTKEYGLGPVLMVLGELYRKTLDLRRVSAPFLTRLAQQSGDAAHLVVLSGNKSLCVDHAIGEHSLQSIMSVGETFPLHVGASSKFLLLSLPEEKRSEILDELDFERFTENTITDRATLEREIRVAQTQGYYLVVEDYELGTTSIAAPVRDHSGGIVATITLIIPLVRLTDSHREEMIDLVVDHARELSRKLGHLSK